MPKKSHDNQRLLVLVAIPIAIELGLAWTLYLLLWKA
jgi:hypothetical protein